MSRGKRKKFSGGPGVLVGETKSGCVGFPVVIYLGVGFGWSLWFEVSSGGGPFGGFFSVLTDSRVNGSGIVKASGSVVIFGYSV